MSDDGADILHPITREVVDHCDGPVAGHCPRAGRGGVVACAGHNIHPDNGAPEYVMLWIPPNSRQCPLAWNLGAVGI